ncbi:MAG: S-methyl-5'-thioadenosine phosphorylase [Litorivicinaceae bacterium]|nr:S-methyl-5'-thioadenosine phosphorylase [Gammaproteobacteria bacterium]RZO81783.1 MAG: S-methyl-5'-thioadenosine phosphorylase [Litorivicinaceae bacterium]|tara:strand:+ start:627 stop:1484 length:858 start_codon:yes stop_codon:yes gene_type:complete
MNEIFGVIGGSGVYDIDSLRDAHWVKVATPFGDPSDEFLMGVIGTQKFAFLPRHGRGHRYSPTGINYRANIWAFKSLGVRRVLSVSAVGSLREEFAPGDFVLVEQYIDRTTQRVSSFFSNGCVGHVSMAHPVCPDLSKIVHQAAKTCGMTIHPGGTYLAMEGPQFSTQAESNLYRIWGCDVIGMTNMPEAKLAREAAICYSSLAMVTDYDCWHPDHDNVSVEQVIGTLLSNSDKSKAVVHALEQADGLFNRSNCQCSLSNKHSKITANSAQDPAVVEGLQLILDN